MLAVGLQVRKVERIQNPILWQSFAVKSNVINQAETAQNNHGDKTKMWLFHGTSEDTGKSRLSVYMASLGYWCNTTFIDTNGLLSIENAVILPG